MKYNPQNHTYGNTYSEEFIESLIPVEFVWSNLMQRRISVPKVFFMGMRLPLGYIKQKLADNLHTQTLYD